VVCQIFREDLRLARKTGQIVGRGRHRWLVRVFLGRDHETRQRRYHSRIVRGPVRHAQTYLNKVLREHDLGRQVDGSHVTLNEYLDRWLETAAKPGLREKSYRGYESLLRRQVRPVLGDRNLASVCPLDIQAAYQQVALTTGARPNEYLALKWQDMDWQRGTASINRTLEKGAGRFAETKRARSRRVIKLQRWVLELLKDLNNEPNSKPAYCVWPVVAELIFTTPAGRPIDMGNLAKIFTSILRQTGLPIIRLYDLRHTGATLALAAGVPPKVVSEQLGHASAAFTLDIYSHVLPHMQDDAAAKVEAVLLGNGTSSASAVALAR